jgi:hypothetical protein
VAKDADCSDRTVRTALASMRDLGLLRCQNRLVRNGWRSEQVSNQYELIPTAEGPETVFPRKTVSCGGKFCPQTQYVEIQEKPAYEVREAQAALARVRERMEQRMLRFIRQPPAPGC